MWPECTGIIVVTVGADGSAINMGMTINVGKHAGKVAGDNIDAEHAAALPLCKNQFVYTMQETSVVGYLAVMDLTRASSVVSSRTMDALFGLLAVTAIYFIIGAVVKRLMGLLVTRKGGALA